MIFGLLGLANLTQNDVLQFHPFTLLCLLRDPVKLEMWGSLRTEHMGQVSPLAAVRI
jgi:hypothetical protein